MDQRTGSEVVTVDHMKQLLRLSLSLPASFQTRGRVIPTRRKKRKKRKRGERRGRGGETREGVEGVRTGAWRRER